MKPKHHFRLLYRIWRALSASFLIRARLGIQGFILIALCTIALPAIAQTHYHRIVFHLDVALTNGLSPQQVGVRLQDYVTDLNTLFAKNTRHRLTFNPSNDIEVAANFPSYGGWSGSGNFPEDPTFTIRVLVSRSSTYSYGGLACVNQAADGVVANLMWDTIHDRASLGGRNPADWEVWNYWRQFHNLAHEMAHLFGAGYGEYYSFRELCDTTGVPPHASEHFGGRYWSEHADFYTDPLIVWVPQLPITQLTNEVRFSDLTAAIVDGVYRDPFRQDRLLTDLSRTKVTVLDGASQQGMAGVPVKAWKVKANGDWAATPLFETQTDSNGQIEFNWPAQPSNFDGLLLIKAYPPNRPPLYRWQTIYDAQIARLLRSEEVLNIVLAAPTPALSVQTSGEMLQLSWSGELVGYTLQWSTDLESWQSIAEGATLQNTVQPGDHVVFVAMEQPRCYFRLVPPPAN